MTPSSFSEALAHYRESSGLSQTELAIRAGLSLSSVNRWERGGSLPRRESAELLDDVLDTGGHLLVRFDETRDGVALPPWARDLVSIESEARTVDVVAPVLVPGYLQSPGYAAALFRAARPWDSPDDVRRLVSLRTQRLEQLGELRVTAVFPVTAVTSPVLPREVRTEQVESLLSWVGSGRVSVHLVPPETILLAPTAPVMVFRVRDGEAVICNDHATGSVVVDSVEHPRLLQSVSAALAAALPAPDSVRILKGLLA